MEDNFQEVKLVENTTIIVLLLIIFIILLPSVTIVISKSMKLSAKTSTTGTVEIVKELYLNMNMSDNVVLPFKVVFNKKGYDLYTNNERFIPLSTYKIKHEGKLPTGGSVEIDSSGYTNVKDLKFGLYKCTQIKDGDITCKL